MNVANGYLESAITVLIPMLIRIHIRDQALGSFTNHDIRQCLSRLARENCVHRTKETDRDRDRNSAAARGAAAMEGEESAAAVPDPGFVLDAASGLYYHARFAFVS